MEKNKIYQLPNIDRTAILQGELDPETNKTIQEINEKHRFKPGLRSDWKIVAKTFLGSYKMKYDQLLDIHYTQNYLDKNEKTKFI